MLLLVFASSWIDYIENQPNDGNSKVSPTHRELPVAIISTCSKNRMKCDIKVSLCKNLHLFSYFWNHYQIIGGKFAFFHTSQQNIANNAYICSFYPTFTGSCGLATAVYIRIFSKKLWDIFQAVTEWFLIRVPKHVKFGNLKWRVLRLCNIW